MTEQELQEAASKKGQRVGYVRVSTVKQNTARQLEQMKEEKVERLFQDHVSAKSTARPELEKMLSHVREHDILIVTSMDRLARNLRDLLDLVADLTKRGVTVRFLKENLTFDRKANSVSKLVLNIMGAVAEFERELLLERQLEGIACAKDEGKYKGREFKLTLEQGTELRSRIAAGGNKTALAREYGITRTTLYQYMKAEKPPKYPKGKKAPKAA